MLEAKLSEKEVKEVYGNMSGFYDFWAHLTEAKARKIALEKSGIKNGQNILEVAVGTGILFEVIKRLQANNDLDEEYFQIVASKKTKNTKRLDDILKERQENSKIASKLLKQLEI